MQVYYDRLITLVDSLPIHNSQRSVEQLYKIFDDYKSILNIVNETNADLKRDTDMHYSELNDIQSEIEQSKNSKSQKQKDESFRDAINHLRDDISSLAEIIKYHDQSDQK